MCRIPWKLIRTRSSSFFILHSPTSTGLNIEADSKTRIFFAREDLSDSRHPSGQHQTTYSETSTNEYRVKQMCRLRITGDFAREDLSDLHHISISIKLLILIEEYRIWFQTAGPRSRLQPHNETVKAGYIAIYERLLELALLITISIEKNSHFFSNLIVLPVYEKLVSTYR